MECVSISKLGLSVVGGVFGVVGIILALKDAKLKRFPCFLRWLSNGETSSEKSWLVPGLQNLGNNCFLNVILQSLASCSRFELFIQKIIENCESSSSGEQVESLPLAYALVALLRDLQIACDERVTLSPRSVMHAMDSYIPNFNLTSQQDAEEAFFHLLSCLREEFSECYVPKHNSLSIVYAFPNKIIMTERREELSEYSRWQQHFLGPFDGIICSILTCRSCSFQVSLDYEFFNSLSLPLVLNNDCPTMFGTLGYTLEDCLKQFIAAEKVENYHCSHCWHIAAIKYLSSTNSVGPAIEMLRCCAEEDSCRCRNISQLESLPWSNRFSCTYKQLVIARYPKILCFHLQRASINEFGEPFKVQGEIRFPIILKVWPWMKSSEKVVYDVVSVVEHMGRGGESGGHYSVYRRVGKQWFWISDSEVCSVSQDHVLAAQPTLLFYETQTQTQTQTQPQT